MSTHAVPDPPPDKDSKEPAMKVAAITSATTALVGLLLAFNVGVTAEQGAAIVTALVALAALAPIVSGYFTRGQVYAPATVAKMMDEAESRPGRDASRRWPEEMK